jgi:hypothetical protein
MARSDFTISTTLTQTWRVSEEGFLEVVTTPKSKPDEPVAVFAFSAARLIGSLENAIDAYNWPTNPNSLVDLTDWVNLKNFFADIAEKIETLLLEVHDK